MITIRNLTVAYNSNAPVIENLQLTLPTQQVHGLVGLNGAGKTTLLQTIFGLKKAQAGSILYNEQHIRKQLVAYLETDNYFYSNITGNEYLSLFVNPNFDIKGWNDIFELPLDVLIENYSTGMKKKLALLGILKFDKPIVILDEPFNGLDLETCRILQTIIVALKKQNRTIIVTSHILESLMPICDQIHYLSKGKILFTKPKEQFHELEKAIFGDFAKDDMIRNMMS